MSGNCPIENIGDRGAAYGIPGLVADGNDLFAVAEAAQQAVTRARAGQGPTLIEFKTYRHRAHCMVIPEHRPGAERTAWHHRDPIEKLGRDLLARGVADEAELERLRRAVDVLADQRLHGVEQHTDDVLDSMPDSPISLDTSLAAAAFEAPPSNSASAISPARASIISPRR